MRSKVIHTAVKAVLLLGVIAALGAPQKWS